MNLHVNIYHECLRPGVHVWEKKWFRINKTIFSVHIVYMYIVYIYRICFYAHFNFSHVYVKYLFRNGNFCNENYTPPPPINLIFLVCCYSMSFHLNNNSNILACYMYICTHVSSPFLLILFFFCAFCKEYTGIQKIYYNSTYL